MRRIGELITAGLAVAASLATQSRIPSVSTISTPSCCMSWESITIGYQSSFRDSTPASPGVTGDVVRDILA